MDAFELWVLAQPDPTKDVTALQAVLESLTEELDTILEARVSDFKSLL